MMVVAFEGWNDAGEAASAAIEHLQLTWEATAVDELSSDGYYDFQVSRPTVHMVDGVTRRIDWPTTLLSRCTPPGFDHDLVLVQGPEPNLHWRAFCDELIGKATDLEVDTVVMLGSLLADTAHTRPVRVTGSSYDSESAERHGFSSSSYEGPTGITGVFHYACVEAGIPAISIWASVPHYVSQSPSPKVTLALLRKLEEVLDLEIPVGELPEQAEEWQRTVSELAEEDDEVSEYVRSLEERGDAESDLSETSGEQLAADFERYLRRRRGGSA